MSQTYHLPWPPTANTMWRHTRGRNKAYLSERYTKWRDEAGKELIRQKARPVKGPVSVTIILRSPNRQAWDVDNRIKPVLDLLVEMMVLPDDNSQVVREILVHADHDESIAIGARVFLSPFVEPSFLQQLTNWLKGESNAEQRVTLPA